MNIADGLATLLFVPGSRPDRFAKALACAADAVCIDLEDSVPEGGKPEARAAARRALAGGDPRLCVRINGVKTRAGLEDLVAFGGSDVPLLLVPKVESAAEAEVASAALSGRSAIVPLIETTRGLRAAHEIAAAPGVAALMFGGGDLSAELGVEMRWEPLRVARGNFILACAGAGVAAIDTPFIALEDTAGLEAETRAARELGFTAKAAIHPAQIDPIRSVLCPTAAEIAEAEEARRVFTEAGGAPVRFKGRMLETPIMRRYERVLAMRSKQCATV